MLILIISGEGKRYIVDSIESFSAGDVVLVGKCLPHVWRSTPPEEELDETNSCQSIVIHFPENFMGEHFLEMQESRKLKTLFQKAQMGIFFGELTRKNFLKCCSY